MRAEIEEKIKREYLEKMKREESLKKQPQEKSKDSYSDITSVSQNTSIRTSKNCKFCHKCAKKIK